MRLSLFSIWKFDKWYGFHVLGVDQDREDDMIYCLIGFAWDGEDKVLEIDLFWRCMTYNFSRS